jgi:hypothetical protein
MKETAASVFIHEVGGSRFVGNVVLYFVLSMPFGFIYTGT